MNIDLRQAVKNNLKGLSSKEIYQTIEESANIKEDKALPGLGIIFEAIWKSSDESLKLSLVEQFSKNL